MRTRHNTLSVVYWYEVLNFPRQVFGASTNTYKCQYFHREISILYASSLASLCSRYTHRRTYCVCIKYRKQPLLVVSSIENVKWASQHNWLSLSHRRFFIALKMISNEIKQFDEPYYLSCSHHWIVPKIYSLSRAISLVPIEFIETIPFPTKSLLSFSFPSCQCISFSQWIHTIIAKTGDSTFHIFLFSSLGSFFFFCIAEWLDTQKKSIISAFSQ